ncbi:GspE/PulE family protein [Ferrovum myxofaciens]|uniref:Flp pilus assembly complex ATPase component TadA n=1 Tax=Ferrovum myxofaciens TaxID=416213 RepID=A0A9E6SXS3_9PROT|nr:ATPase, T2SS/T4P/T4SS family [Ferrovum myxofaciens]QKE37388.1 MAG: Flp pilus assembly complex ATPase component TadA [Ferrovum myxofaciens]QWY75042.1 MAG: Flp pilus assembly complex ATPase component TadA [Ferrovum myxofaciens]QWY77782.1 MAG: Flp pilus assembly complex ATPase component TadA [Ferrovum myxofaciens]
MSLEPDLFVSSGRSDAEACQILNGIFTEAARKRVADIHLRDDGHSLDVRFRLPGGELWTYTTLSMEVARQVDTKIRARSKMAFNERQAAMDGRMSLKVDGGRVDVRVSLTPGVGGTQLIVNRLLMQSNAEKKLSDVRMTPAVRQTFHQLIREPNGLFVVTGPTGSGKTTTLYAVLNELNNGKNNIITIENPVEYRVKGLHQIDVCGGLTFAQALRAVLRQDPDVILVGEIRDSETAHVAIDAAITGHLVLSTLHANTAAEAVTRFIELGVDPMTLGAALRGVSAQRLISTVRPDCPKRPPTEAQVAWLANHGIRPDNGTEYPHIENRQDFNGFSPVMELVITDRAFQQVMNQGAQKMVNSAAGQPQFEGLAQAGERMAAMGHTTLEEVMRVVSSIDAVKIVTKRIGEMAVSRGHLSRHTLWAMLDERATALLDAGITATPPSEGKLLVERGYCTREQVVDMIGYTWGAQNIMENIIRTDDARFTYQDLLGKWTPGENSLFELAYRAGLCDFGGISQYVNI